MLVCPHLHNIKIDYSNNIQNGQWYYLIQCVCMFVICFLKMPNHILKMTCQGYFGIKILLARSYLRKNLFLCNFE